MESLSYKTEKRGGILRQAKESLFIAAPEIEESLIDGLFALSTPVDIGLLVNRGAVADHDRRVRDNIKRLMDINLNIDVRVVDECFPAFTIVDDKHLHCFSEASKRLATREPDRMADAARSLWARAKPLVPPHPSRSLPA